VCVCDGWMDGWDDGERRLQLVVVGGKSAARRHTTAPDDVKETATSLLHAQYCLQLRSKSRSLIKRYKTAHLTVRDGVMIDDVVV
jgi:hypothetical protein